MNREEEKPKTVGEWLMVVWVVFLSGIGIWFFAWIFSEIAWYYWTEEGQVRRGRDDIAAYEHERIPYRTWSKATGNPNELDYYEWEELRKNRLLPGQCSGSGCFLSLTVNSKGEDNGRS